MIYLVDGENVSLKSLSGFKHNGNNYIIDFNNPHKLLTNEEWYIPVNVYTEGVKDCLDGIICAMVGYIYGSGIHRRVIIVSKDHGYDKMVQWVDHRGYPIIRSNVLAWVAPVYKIANERVHVSTTAFDDELLVLIELKIDNRTDKTFGRRRNVNVIENTHWSIQCFRLGYVFGKYGSRVNLYSICNVTPFFRTVISFFEENLGLRCNVIVN